MEAVWTYRGIDAVNVKLLRELLECENHHAKAAATRQIRYWHPHLKDTAALLKSLATDSQGLVRLEAVIAAAYVGTPEALDAVMASTKLPHDKHLTYAITTALGSKRLARHWKNDPKSPVTKTLARMQKTLARKPKEPRPTRKQRQFDRQGNVKVVRIDCVPERMAFTVKQFIAKPGQPIKIVFFNEDATDHNLVLVKPGALAEVGMAANEMAKDPRNADSDFIPREKKDLILQASPMIGPNRKSQVHVLRFRAPNKPGIYPYVCTFPGHWVVMSGIAVIAKTPSEAEKLLASRKPTIVRNWKLSDFENLKILNDERTIMRGMRAFTKARCLQCHQMSGHGVNLGPDLTKTHEKYKGAKLLQQILAPSSEINEKYQAYQFYKKNGLVVNGFVVKETPKAYHVAQNLLLPNQLTLVKKTDVEEKKVSKISSMPEGLINVLTKEEILDLLGYLQAGGYQLPKHLKHHHSKSKEK